MIQVRLGDSTLNLNVKVSTVLALKSAIKYLLVFIEKPSGYPAGLISTVNGTPTELAVQIVGLGDTLFDIEINVTVRGPVIGDPRLFIGNIGPLTSSSSPTLSSKASKVISLPEIPAKPSGVVTSPVSIASFNSLINPFVEVSQ